MNKFRKLKKTLAVMLCMALVLSVSGCGKLFSGKTIDEIISGVADVGNSGTGKETDTSAAIENSTEPAETENGAPGSVAAMVRKLLLGSFTGSSNVNVEAAVSEPGISSVSEAVNYGAFHLSEEEEALLGKNGFIVTAGGSKEFYKLYEMNRYSNLANFVTVDSMMHAYHMYFAYLLRNTERNYLSDRLLKLSESLLEESRNQYKALLGTEWEDAALRNVAYFTVGAVLQNENETIDGYAADMVNAELDRIYAADDIYVSDMTGKMLDYSQFKPRGYYSGDAGLEKYFRAMMWYGQI